MIQVYRHRDIEAAITAFQAESKPILKEAQKHEYFKPKRHKKSKQPMKKNTKK